ncbi:hypothetical protein [Loigolactobacillus zhaoyuanensis]|uniref:Competence protein ComGD n=1 Tax=Loigolactobacillus zhaoyuanensis TaxID=2486017 RepID=A0ABW8UH87_9LACO|nr:hypothetical protein [Loigolactobacillus zhaoyuanensis]
MKHSGFTLLESVIVLGLVTSFALIPLTQFGPIKQQHAEQLFFDDFDQEWRYLQAYTLLRGERVKIHITRHQATFITFQGQKPMTTKNLMMPAGLHADLHNLSIDPPGQMGPSQISFWSDYFQRPTTIKPQMGWGIYE